MEVTQEQDRTDTPYGGNKKNPLNIYLTVGRLFI